MRNLSTKPALVSELEKRFQFQKPPRRLWLAAVTLLALLGCAPVPLTDGERRVALRETTEQVILPTYAELRERTSELSAALDDLEADPNEADLDQLRALYLRAREPLKEAEAFGFGPASELRSATRLDQAPIAPQKIDQELASDTVLTQQSVRTLGADKQGLHAVEYLLFPESDAALEAALLEDGGAGARRRLYLSLVGHVIRDAAIELEEAWAPDSGNYAGRFSAPGADDSVAKSVQAGLDTLLNQLVFLSEVIADTKLGKPLGSDGGSAIAPEAQESERSGASLSDILGNLRGLRNVYVGTRDGSVGVSLSSLVQAKSPVVNRRALEAIARAEATVRAIPEPLTDALTEDAASVTEAYESIKTLKRVLSTEVLGTLGASLQFNENDGD